MGALWNGGDAWAGELTKAIRDSFFRHYSARERRMMETKGLRDRIREAMLDLACEQGYEGVSLGQILERAGASRKSSTLSSPPKKSARLGSSKS